MSDAADDVALELFSVEPTSLAGAAALLRYFSEATDGGVMFPESVIFDGDGRSISFGQAIARHVADALGKLGRSSVGAASDAAFVPIHQKSEADAKLIALGREYEELITEYYTARPQWSRALAQAQNEQEAQFGDPAERNYQDTPKMRRAWEKRCARLGVREADDKLYGLALARWPIEAAIYKTPVRSIEGLRAKAMVSLFDIRPLGADDMHYEFSDQDSFQRLFCAVAQLTGLDAKVAAMGYSMPQLPTCEPNDEEKEAHLAWRSRSDRDLLPALR